MRGLMILRLFCTICLQSDKPHRNALKSLGCIFKLMGAVEDYALIFIQPDDGDQVSIVHCKRRRLKGLSDDYPVWKSCYLNTYNR